MRAYFLRFSIVAVLFCSVAAIAAGQEAPQSCTDQVWVVDTHCVCCADLDSVGFRQLQADRSWASSDLNGFLAADDPGTPTVIFVPGNRATTQDAVEMAWQVHQMLKVCGAGCVRTVAWAWPAERVSRRNRPDVQTKACRSDLESHLLGLLLSRIDPAVRVRMVGYSFGARVIAGGLHLQSGGTLNGVCLPEVVQRTPMRAVFVAAAIDTDWLVPGHRNGLAMTQLEHLLVTVNSADTGLRFYPLMYGRGGPHAMGFCGPDCCGCMGDKLELLNLTCEVGRNHDWDVYFCSPSLRARLAVGGE